MTFFLVSKSTISGKITLFFQTFTLKIIKTLHFNHYLSDLVTIHPPKKAPGGFHNKPGASVTIDFSILQCVFIMAFFILSSISAASSGLSVITSLAFSRPCARRLSP